MRLLKLSSHDELSLTKDLLEDVPPYAILSHTWSTNDDDEVTFIDLESGCGKSKSGYAKLQFCGKQARKDGIEYFWVDTCCINKANHAELSEAITSMFRWYRDAKKCYVYLSDVSNCDSSRNGDAQRLWESSFRTSRWFTRGWTLQELLAPRSVEFFSREEELLGDKMNLEQVIHEITKIPITALRGSSLSYFSVADRMRWAANRSTKRKEDKAYCLLGIFDIFLPLIYGEGDNASIRLQEELDKRYSDQKSGSKNINLIKLMTGLTLPGSSEPTFHKHWLIPRTANAMFTGRENLLQELEKSVRDAVEKPQLRTQCRIVISGIGGQGKSELCLQLARRLRKIFWGVFWVDVSTTSLAEKSFLDIAEKVSQPAQTWEQARLGIANLQHPWLLVLDNADDPDVDYQHYFPDSPLGAVILTSRNEECRQYATIQSISLEGLSEGEARDLLLKATHVPQDQWSKLQKDAEMVAPLLQSHPLALIQAAAYVSGGHCTLADYPSVYERQRRRLLTFRPRQAQSRYRDVYATFEASADVLKSSRGEAAQDALRLLPILAAGGPSQFPLSLFERAWGKAKIVPSDMDDDAENDNALLLTPWHVAHLPSVVDTTAEAWDPFRLVEAVNFLKAFALVSTHSHNGQMNVSMHPLVHAWARDRQDDIEQHQNWLRLGCLMAFALQIEDVRRAREQRLLSHVEALTAWELTTIFAADSPAPELVTRVLVKCGWVLNELRADRSLFMLIQKIFVNLELHQLHVKQQWLGLYELTARNLFNCGKINDAMTLLEQIVKIREQTQAEEDSDRLASQHGLARAYEANGQVEEAVALLEKVVKITEQTHAEDHLERLASQHELAGAYLANGQVTEAVALQEHVVKVKEQMLAEDHPYRLASQHELARAYLANGQMKEAVALLEHVVKIEESLAEDHPDRLISQFYLAIGYWDIGRRKPALQVMKHVAEVWRWVLDESHPNRIAAEERLEEFENALLLEENTTGANSAYVTPYMMSKLVWEIVKPG